MACPHLHPPVLLLHALSLCGMPCPNSSCEENIFFGRACNIVFEA